MPEERELQSHELEAFHTDEAFVILEGDDLDELLADEARLRTTYQAAIEAHEAGVISENAFNKIKERVQLLLQRCNKVVSDIEVFLEKKQAEYEEARRAAEEARRQAEEEERRRREAELQRQREAEERKRLEEEAKKLEPQIHWRERESVYFKIRTIGLEQGAFAVKTMYEEALQHKDWPIVAKKLLERYKHHEPLPHTWTQLVNSGLLTDMPNIFPNSELNPVVVPGFIICKESPISDKQVFVIVNVESPDRFRYTSSTIVKMSEIE